jgi:hypothetical protein
VRKTLAETDPSGWGSPCGSVTGVSGMVGVDTSSRATADPSDVLASNTVRCDRPGLY